METDKVPLEKGSPEEVLRKLGDNFGLDDGVKPYSDWGSKASKSFVCFVFYGHRNRLLRPGLASWACGANLADDGQGA